MIALLVNAWAGPLEPARTDPLAPPSAAEERAARDVASVRCAEGLVVWVPGGLQLCQHRTAEGASLLALSAAELAAGVAILATAPPQEGALYLESGELTLLLAATEPLVYSQAAYRLDVQRARRLPYVPNDRTGDLFLAPFRPRVLARPAVWGGTVGLLGAAFTLQALTDGFPTPTLARPNLLGAHPPAGVGYGAIALLDAGLALQVATAEEAVFRGLLQSGLARELGETPGFLVSTLVFGGAHALNAVFLAPEDRVPYLAYGVPFITVTGAWLGLTYRWAGYSLAPPVAGHFWYDTVLLATAAVVDPEHHAFSLSFGGSL